MYLLDIVANATKYNTSLKCYATHTLANIQSHPNDDDTYPHSQTISYIGAEFHPSSTNVLGQPVKTSEKVPI